MSDDQPSRSDELAFARALFSRPATADEVKRTSPTPRPDEAAVLHALFSSPPDDAA